MKLIFILAAMLIAFGVSAQSTPENLIIHLKSGEEAKCPLSSIERVTFGNDGDNPVNPPINNGVITGSAEPRAFSATISGIYSGSKLPTVLGFQYSYDPSFPANKTGGYFVDGRFGGVNFYADGLVDQIKVYYRVLAIIDGEYLYGETKSFETPQGTYTIDGETYKFIKVTGLPTGSFSMMQTELPPNAELTIDGESIGCLSGDYNATKMTKGEARGFWEKFAKAAVLPRYPTPQEWMYAAAGGSESKGYTYSGSDDIDTVAWYIGNSNGKVRKPAQKEPNELGFYDMSGNYAECCGSYDEDQLKDIIELYVNRFVHSLHNVSASYVDTSWNTKGGVFGGYWGSPYNKCEVSSSENYSDPIRNYIDGNFYTVRFVYSRPD